MKSRARFWAGMVALTVLPGLHPVLLPVVGVASHLLWWAHVLPLALLTHRMGQRALGPGILGSVALLVLGERLFGAGYWIPADWATVLSLAVALVFTEVLVGGFALYARRVSRKYQVLFERAETGVIRTTPGGRVMEANPAATRILQLEPGSLEERSLEEVSQLAPLPPLAEVVAQGGWTGTVEVQTTRGPRTRHLAVAALRQDEPGGYQVLLMDRTLDAAADRERERQGKLATLGEALAGVAHELKNPLAVILAEGELAHSTPDLDPKELLDSITEMSRQGRRIQELVDELLGFSRPASGEGPVDLACLLRRLLRMETMIRGGSVTWQDRIRYEGRVSLPQTRVEQIVINLMANAAEAMDPEGGTAELRCWAEKDSILIEVADTGPGIPDSLVDEVFTPFMTTKVGEGGTGLGLAISRRLAMAMGGELTARNRASGGAAFRLVLPLVRPKDPAELTPAA